LGRKAAIYDFRLWIQKLSLGYISRIYVSHPLKCSNASTKEEGVGDCTVQYSHTLVNWRCRAIVLLVQ
jgi:hypothetical protein